MRNSILLIIVYFLQNCTGSIGQESNKVKVAKNETAPFSLSIGGNYSSIGLGTNLQLKVTEKIGFRIGLYKGNLKINYFRYLNGTGLDIKSNLNFVMVPLLLDYNPFPNSSFRFTGGIAVNNNNYEVNVKPSSNQKYGYITYDKDYFGGIAANVTFKRVAPYLGIGFGNLVPKHRIGLGMDMGLLYTGKPIFDLNCTGIFVKSDTQENIDLLNDAFKMWSTYPFINFNINYRIIP